MVDISEKTGSYLVLPQTASLSQTYHEFGEGLFPAQTLLKAATHDSISEYGLFGYIDLNGQWIIPPMYRGAGKFSEGLACVTLNDFGDATRNFGFIDKNNKLILSYEYQTEIWAYFSDELCPAYIWTDRKSWKTLWGYIDKTGEWVIKPQFSIAGNFKDGVAVVEINGLYGVISR